MSVAGNYCGHVLGRDKHGICLICPDRNRRFGKNGSGEVRPWTVGPEDAKPVPPCPHGDNPERLDELGKCLYCVWPSLMGPEPPEPEADPARAALMRLRASAAKEAKKNLAIFVKQAWHVLHPSAPEPEWNWHMDVMCQHLQATFVQLMRARKDPSYIMEWQNLLCNVPPRSGKTVVTGVFFPVWMWLHDPSLKIRYTSGNPRMVSIASRNSRDLIESEWFKATFGVEWSIRTDQDSIGLYTNTLRGERHSTSFESRVVGEGTDVIIVDDPIDPDDAHNEKARESVRVTWNEALANRVNTPRACARLGIMQRVDSLDWSAIVLEQNWRHLCIPMEREEKPACTCADCQAGVTVLGWKDPRQPGEVLHPARFSKAFLEAELARLGSYGYAGQMQQRPAPEGGGVFKAEWIQRVDPIDQPLYQETAIFCDLTFGGSKIGSSRNCLLVAGRQGVNRYVLEVIAKAMDVVEIKREMRRLHEKYPRAKFIIENKAAGAPVMAEMRREIPGIVDYDPGKGDKVSRAMSVQPYVEGKNLHILKGAGWADEYVYEMTTFPNARFDDQVDATSMMLDYWRQARSTLRAYKL